MESSPQYFSKKKRNNTFKFLGFAISGILLWLTINESKFEWHNLILTKQQWLYWSGSVLAFMTSIWIQSVRAKLVWKTPGKTNHTIDTYSGYILGNFYNCLIPANLGDGVRAYHFSRKFGTSFNRSLAAIITEKWLDGLLYVIFPIILFSTTPFTTDVVPLSILLIAAIALILWGVYILMLKYKKLEKALWLPIYRYTGKPGRFIHKLYWHTTSNIKLLIKNRLIIHYVLYTLVAFIINAVQFTLLIKATGVQTNGNDLYTGLLASAGSMALVFIPSAPGNVGVLHYGIFRILIYSAQINHLTIQPEDLQSFALYGIFLHLSFFVPEVLMGIIFLVKERRLLF